MHPILLQLGPFHLYSWGAMVALGFLAGILFILWLAKNEGMAWDNILDLAFYVLLASIIGARLFYVIQFWRDFQGNVWRVLAVQEGGLVFYGGFLGVLAVIALYVYLKKLNIWKLLDVIAPGVALGYAIGRLGCFLNGCCYGVATSLPWGISFPAGSLANYAFGVKPLHPTQLYGALAGLLIFIILMLIRRYKKFDGMVVLIGIMLYSAYRFAIEFIRTNPTYFWHLTGNPCQGTYRDFTQLTRKLAAPQKITSTPMVAL